MVAFPSAPKTTTEGMSYLAFPIASVIFSWSSFSSKFAFSSSAASNNKTSVPSS